MPEVAASPPAPLTADRLSPPQDRGRLDRVLAAYLADARRVFAGNAHARPLFDRLAEFALRGGKRLRPRLCLAGYRIVAGRPGAPPTPVWLASACLELFHAFMLVHDDLIDGSLLRRGRPTLHEAIRLDVGDPDHDAGRKRSADLGLLAGDLLFALGMRLLGRSGLDPAAHARAQRLVADMLLDTGLGEALDVLYDGCPLGHLGEEEIIEAYLRKTARYSVSGPLVLGATLAGAPESTCRALARFGDLLGFGYQVQNDLDALAADPESGDHPDLDFGKRTFVLWKAHRRLPEPGRRALDEALAAPPGLDRRRKLLALIRASGAVDECVARLEGVRREAVDVLRESALDPSQRRLLLALAELFRPAGLPAAWAEPDVRAAGLTVA